MVLNCFQDPKIEGYWRAASPSQELCSKRFGLTVQIFNLRLLDTVVKNCIDPNEVFEVTNEHYLEASGMIDYFFLLGKSYLLKDQEGQFMLLGF